MVVIRLARRGIKKYPFYQIVVSNSSNKRDGGFIERVGFFNPIVSGKSKELFLNLDRVKYWISLGAFASKRVSALIKKIKKMQ